MGHRLIGYNGLMRDVLEIILVFPISNAECLLIDRTRRSAAMPSLGLTKRPYFRNIIFNGQSTDSGFREYRTPLSVLTVLVVSLIDDERHS